MKKNITASLFLAFASLSLVSAANVESIDHSYGYLSEASVLSSDIYSGFQAKPVKGYKEVTFATHLHCQDCVKKVTENISYEKGVKDLEVSLEKQTIYIKYDPKKTDEAKLKAAIEKLGYEVHKAEQ